MRRSRSWPVVSIKGANSGESLSFVILFSMKCGKEGAAALWQQMADTAVLLYDRYLSYWQEFWYWEKFFSLLKGVPSLLYYASRSLRTQKKSHIHKPTKKIPTTVSRNTYIITFRSSVVIVLRIFWQMCLRPHGQKGTNGRPSPVRLYSVPCSWLISDHGYTFNNEARTRFVKSEKEVVNYNENAIKIKYSVFFISCILFNYMTSCFQYIQIF